MSKKKRIASSDSLVQNHFSPIVYPRESRVEDLYQIGPKTVFGCCSIKKRPVWIQSIFWSFRKIPWFSEILWF